MSRQRRRGERITFYKPKTVRNNRGDAVKVPDLDTAWETTCAETADRSSRMEIPGQGAIDIIGVIVSAEKDLALFGRAKFRGQAWDIVGPPSYRHGTRHTRHQTVMLRRRPGPEDVFGEV